MLKRDLESRHDYSTLAAYRAIDKYNDGAITINNLGGFLRSCGYSASQQDLIQIIRRIDTNGDGILSYFEFADFIKSNLPII